MKKLALLLGLFSILMFFGSASATIWTCNNCSGCSTKVLAATNGDIVNLTSDISNQVGSCVIFYNNFSSGKNGITFDCQGHIIEGDLSGNDVGIDLFSATAYNNTIKNCIITKFNRGIWLNVENNSIYDSQLIHNDGGTITGSGIFGGSYSIIKNVNITQSDICIYPDIHTIIYNDSLMNCVVGIQLAGSSGRYINILGTLFIQNTIGVWFLTDTLNNIINDSLFKNNTNWDIYFQNDMEFISFNNLFYNNLFNSTKNIGFQEAAPYSYIEYWNNTMKGNYWAYPNGTGFSQTCIDANSDGICDTSYILDANNVDFLPLHNASSVLIYFPSYASSTVPPSSILISNLGQFSTVAGLIMGAGLLLFLLDGLFGSVGLLKDPKNLITLFIGALIIASVITIFFV